MNRTTKLVLDILLGAVVPILILDRLSEPLGNIPAYILAAMIPVAWVFIDLFFITRKFNIITSYVGFTSLVSGLLTFWFVDGLLYAIKDTSGLVLRAAIFGGSVLIGRPIFKYFFIQALNPDTAEREQSLNELLRVSDVNRAIVVGTALIVVETLLSAAFNFYLNINMVTAAFDTLAFNQQIAQVNAITRIALTIPSFIVFGIAMWLIYRAIYRHLPKEDGKSQLESDFWDLIKMRESGHRASAES